MNWKTTEVCRIGGRKNNQDYCKTVSDGEKGCWVVADGLGGYQGGAIASRLVVDTVIETWRHQPFSDGMLKEAFTSAQERLLEQQQQSEFGDMCTTVVVLVRDGNQVLWGHVGDSRLYHFRDGKVVFQTKDHSVPQLLVVTGDITDDQIRGHPDQNRLLRTIGDLCELKPTITDSMRTVEPGDAFLLCSDGFWEYVLETEMESDLQNSETITAWLQCMITRLEERVDGKHDNYTAVLVQVD